MPDLTRWRKCPHCGHEQHKGKKCQFPITETIHDNIGYGGIKPTFQTRIVLVDVCGCTRV